MQGANPISVTTAPCNKLIGKPFYDLPATIEVMHGLRREAAVDGFEFQHVAEWDARCPPRDEGARRLAYWEDSARYTVDQIADILRETGLPVLSIHANRDVGLLLCSGERRDVERGRCLIHESLYLAEGVGASVCVFHFWDTWAEAFDPAFLRRTLDEIAPRYPGVRAAVENVPTHLPGWTPCRLAGEFEWVALDLRWAALYDELDAFEVLRERIVDVHLRGEIAGGRWYVPRAWFPPGQGQASFDFYGALGVLRDRWDYRGPLTVESVPTGIAWEDFVTAIASVLVTVEKYIDNSGVGGRRSAARGDTEYATRITS